RMPRRKSASPEEIFELRLARFELRRQLAQRPRRVGEQERRVREILLALPFLAHPFEVIAAAFQEQLEALGRIGQLEVEDHGVAGQRDEAAVSGSNRALGLAGVELGGARLD